MTFAQELKQKIARKKDPQALMADWIKNLCLHAIEKGEDHVDIQWVSDDFDYSLLSRVIADLGFSSFHWIRTPDKSSIFPRIYFKDVRE